MDYEEEEPNSKLYTILYLVFGLLIVGLSGFIIFTLINGRSNGPSDAGVSETGVPFGDGTTVDPVSNILSDQISNNPKLTRFTELLTSAQLLSKLGSGQYTVFAPVDSVFVTVFDIPTDSQEFSDFVGMHIVEGNYDEAALLEMKGKSLDTLTGEKIKISVKEELLVFTDASGNEVRFISKPNQPADNGQLFFVDGVFYPTISQ